MLMLRDAAVIFAYAGSVAVSIMMMALALMWATIVSFNL